MYTHIHIHTGTYSSYSDRSHCCPYTIPYSDLCHRVTNTNRHTRATATNTNTYNSATDAATNTNRHTRTATTATNTHARATDAGRYARSPNEHTDRYIDTCEHI